MRKAFRTPFKIVSRLCQTLIGSKPTIHPTFAVIGKFQVLPGNSERLTR